MLKRVNDWIDDRTGLRSLLSPWRNRMLPDGPRWEYVTASCLLWMLVVEILTGLLLMTTYSPSATTAWSSIHYIEQMSSGSFIRGVHYYASQALIVLFALHTIRVLLAAAFRKPYELVWASGLVLIPLIVLWAISGNPLSFSQKAVGQIEVEASITGNLPLFGPALKRILLGGDSVGQLSISHFYFLHVALLPILVGFFTAIHIAQICRHGTASQRHTPSGENAVPYYPHQTVRNMIAFCAVFAVVAYLGYVYGAPLEEPADPGLPSSPRPEWYFLFIYELRNHYLGEFVATTVLPVGILLFLLTLPLVDRVMSPRLSSVFRYIVVIGGVLGWTALTLSSLSRDRNDPLHQDTMAKSELMSARAKELADKFGFTAEGAVGLLRSDPLTKGPLLFTANCQSCHDHVDENGFGLKSKAPSAPNLYRFATREWLSGFFDPERINSPAYFGNTAHGESEEGMVAWVNDNVAEMDEDEQASLRKMIVALSAEARLKSQRAADAAAVADGTMEEGVTAIGDLGCTDCHKYHDEGDLGEAPDLTGYGSRKWLIEFISNPEHERFYAGDANDRMPAYAPHEENPQQNRLTEKQIGLIVDWLRADWYEDLSQSPAPEASP